MADVKISALPAATTMDDADIMPIVQGGVTKKVTKAAGMPVGYPVGTKMYLALLTQASTSAPVATVMVNTLGGTLVLARTGAGVYTGTLSGAFTENKTFFPVQVGFAGSTSEEDTKWSIQRTSANVVTIRTTLSNLDPSDDLLNGTPVQILVLP